MTISAMTGKERYLAALRGEKPDRVPLLVGNYNNFITYYYGITVREYLDQPARTAELMARLATEFRFDQFNAGVGYILYGCGPELGVKWQWAGENFPAAVEGPIKSAADVERIQVPAAPSGYFKNYLEIIRRVEQAIGDRVFVQANLLGPFSTACFLRGVEGVMLDSKLDLPLYQKYMARCTEISKYFGRELLKVLKAPSFNEVFLIPEMVSPRFYHEHILPYDSEVCAHLGLRHSASAVMGQPGDEASQKAGRHVYDARYGSKESLAAIEKAIDYWLPGYPIFVAVSGRMLVSWDTQAILDFATRGLEIVHSRNRYPAISLVSVQPPSPASAREVAEKMRALGELCASFKL